MSRFSIKTFVGSGRLASRIYIDAEHVDVALAIFRTLTRHEGSGHLSEVPSIQEDLGRFLERPAPMVVTRTDPPHYITNRVMAMHRGSNAHYDWWILGMDGLYHHVQNLRAVAVLAQNNNGEFASIASVKRNGKIGLPAGGTEFWENPFHAATRELSEEVGLNFTYHQLQFLGATLVGDLDMVGIFVAPTTDQPLTSSEEGEARWVDAKELVGEQGAFPEPTLWALERLRDVRKS